MTQLDERGRAATSALLTQVDDVAVSEWKPRDSHGRQLVIAFAIVALVIAATVAITRRSDDKTSVAAGRGDVPRLLASTPPTGWSASGAADLPLPAGSTPDATFEAVVYAAPDDVDFTGRALAAVVIRGAGASSPNSGQPVDVNGHAGTLGTLDGQAAVTWTEAPGVSVTVVGQNLDNDALVAAARATTINGSDTEINSPPDGLITRAHVHDLTSPGGTGLLAPKDAAGHLVGYRSGEASSIQIMTVAGDGSLLAAERFLATPNATAVEVRGHQGWVSNADPSKPSAWTMVWQESPGVVGEAIGSGVDRSTFVQLVDSLQPATDAEWNALRARTPDAEATHESSSSSVSVSVSSSSLVAPPDVPPGSLGSTFGAVGDSEYTVYVDSNGQLGLTLTSASGSSTSAASGNSTSENRTDVRLVGVGQHGLVYGKVLDTRVSEVRLELPGEGAVQGSLEPVAGQPVSLFAFSFDVSQPGGLTPNSTGTVVLLDASGAEVGRLPVTAFVPN